MAALSNFLHLHVWWHSSVRLVYSIRACIPVFWGFFSFRNVLIHLYFFDSSEALYTDLRHTLPPNSLLDSTQASFMSSLALCRPSNPSKVVLALPTFFSFCNISNTELFPSTKCSLGSQFLNLKPCNIHCWSEKKEMPFSVKGKIFKLFLLFLSSWYYS